MTGLIRTACLVCTLGGLGACTITRVPPPPPASAPATFQEDGLWQRAPAAEPPEAGWWHAFHDPQLDALMDRLPQGNLNLQSLAVQVRNAQASLDAARQALWPSLSVTAGATRSASVATNAQTGQIVGGQPVLGKSVSLGATSSWELDLWGRLGQARDAAQATLTASQFDLDAARVSLQATVAQTYLSWRSAVAQEALLARTVDADTRALQLAQARYDGGVVTRADVLQADTTLQSARAQQAETRAQRAQLQHALATLMGQSAGELNLALPADQDDVTHALPQPPGVPALVPSRVLAWRPDIQAARQRVVSAYAQIGVADAAYYPSLGLSASAGYKGSTVASLLSAPHLYWSLGPSLTEAIFNGGQRDLASAQARLSAESSTLTYRQAVLTAFQEVEDNLVLARELDNEVQALTRARDAAAQNLAIVQAQYAAGTVSFINVTSAQTAALSAELSWLSARNRQLAAISLLMKNLGGHLPPT